MPVDSEAKTRKCSFAGSTQAKGRCDCATCDAGRVMTGLNEESGEMRRRRENINNAFDQTAELRLLLINGKFIEGILKINKGPGLAFYSGYLDVVQVNVAQI